MEHEQLESDVEECGQVDAHTIRARQSLRDELERDLAAFLDSGGNVENVEANLRVDLPRAPQNNYGKGSI